MSFQFTCPAGHVLQAERQHAGQQSQCPICGRLMVIPPCPPPDSGVAERPAAASAGAWPPEGQGGTQGPPPSFVAKEVAVSFPAVPPNVGQAIVAGPQIYHIPCPNGHELETPADMLGQYVMCPECQAQFQLAERDSREYQRRQQIEQEARETRLERFWLNWAIALVLLVVLGLLSLLGISFLNR